MRIARTLLVLPGLLACLSAPAGAEDAAFEATHRTGADILAQVDGANSDSTWLASHLDHVRLHKKRGFAYTRAVDSGERELQWSVQGPRVGRKNAVGLGFELRF